MARILHTADWHLGARLVNHERGEEHARFLEWMLDQMRRLKPDLLIIAGDIFDSANPTQVALTQYYRFLAGVAHGTESQVLVVGGNHDSALTLNAPRDLLRSLRIRVVGCAPELVTDAVFELGNTVVCAGPYLRERDVRRGAPGQTFEEVAAQIRDGIAGYYRLLLDHAVSVARERPIIATGHLTTLGGKGSSSEREIHIGNLGAVGADCFGGFDYVALGHLHRPQIVGGNPRVRYSGSPLALSFEEADTSKEILLVETAPGTAVKIEPILIPSFRCMERIRCRLGQLPEKLALLPREEGELRPWLELTIEDGAAHPDLDRQVRGAAEPFDVAILKLLIPRPEHDEPAGQELFDGRALSEIQPEEAFEERLRRASIEPASEPGQLLMGTFKELLSRMEDARFLEGAAR